MSVYKINGDLRKVTIPPSGQVLGVYHDCNVNRLQFELPRYYRGEDLSQYDILINSINDDGDTDVYVVEDKKTDADKISFTWRVGAVPCAAAGRTGFTVCCRLSDNGTVVKEYNTGITYLKVLDGCEDDSTNVDVSQIQLLVKEITELRLSEAIGKKMIAEAITAKKVVTDASDSYETMSEHIRNIETAGSGSCVVDATEGISTASSSTISCVVDATEGISTSVKSEEATE